MMEIDGDITKVNAALEAFNNIKTVEEKVQKLGDIEKIIGVVFATSEVRDRLHRFILDNLIAFNFDSEEGKVSQSVKIKFYLAVLNFIRKLQTKNFLKRRVELSDWRKILHFVVTALKCSNNEEVWSIGLQLFTASKEATRAAVLPADPKATRPIDQLGNLLCHPLAADRHSMLQRSEGVCRQLLNIFLTTVNVLVEVEAEEGKAGDEATLGPEEREKRRQSLCRLTFLIVSALTSHDSELGRWSLLTTLEQMEAKLVEFLGGVIVPISVLKECNIEKVGKDLQSLLRNWPIQTLRLWRVLVRLLDKCVLTSTCFNALAPVIADSLHKLSNSPRVQLMTQDAWRLLVDIFTFYPGARESYNRMCLLLRVYRRVYTQEVVQIRRLLGWWHFITRLSVNMLHQLYETALTPFLAHVLGYYPLDADTPQSEGEKQFGYRLSTFHAGSSLDCLYFASHVMAEMWLQVDDPDETGTKMRARLLKAVLGSHEPKKTTNSGDEAEKIEVLVQRQLYDEKLDEFPHKNLPMELFTDKISIAERMLKFLQRWLQLWRAEVQKNAADPSDEILIWILSRALRKWLLLVDRTSEQPSSEKTVVRLVTLMVKTMAESCASFNVDLSSRLDCVVAIAARPALKGSMTPHIPNFREWPAFLLFQSIMDFKKTDDDEAYVKDKTVLTSGKWSSIVLQLTTMLADSPLRSLDLFTSVAGLLLRASRSIPVEDPRLASDLLLAWHTLATRLTDHIKRTNEVATGDIAIKPKLDGVEICLSFPFDLAARFRAPLPAQLGPSEQEMSSCIAGLYKTFYPEAILLPTVNANQWCGVMANMLAMVPLYRGAPMDRFLLPAITLCTSMLDQVDASLVLLSEDAAENKSPNSPDSISSISSSSPDLTESNMMSFRLHKRRLEKGLMSPSLRRSRNGTGSPRADLDNAPRSRSSFSPGHWSRGRKCPLGNLTSTYKAFLILLKDLPTVRSPQSQETPDADTPSMTADEANRLATLVCKTLRMILLEKIRRPGPLLTLVEKSATGICNVMDWSESLPSRTLKPALRQRLESIPFNLLDNVKHVCPGPYDSQLLRHVAPIINGICSVQTAPRPVTLTPSQRKSKRAQIAPLVSFWNSTFAECQQLDYPEDLQQSLKNAKNKFRLPIYLPPQTGGSSLPSTPAFQPDDSRPTVTRQDSQALSEYSTPPPSPPKPVQKVGSFLHRSPLLPAALANALPKPSPEPPKPPVEPPRPTPANSLSAKPTVRPRNRTPKRASIDSENSEDFVFVPTPSVRLTRLQLTERQKERMAELRRDNYIPMMYNGLDNSQQSQQYFTRSIFADSNSDSQSQINRESQPPMEVDEIASASEPDKVEDKEADKKDKEADKNQDTAEDTKEDKNEEEKMEKVEDKEADTTEGMEADTTEDMEADTTEDMEADKAEDIEAHKAEDKEADEDKEEEEKEEEKKDDVDEEMKVGETENKNVEEETEKPQEEEEAAPCVKKTLSVEESQQDDKEEEKKQVEEEGKETSPADHVEESQSPPPLARRIGIRRRSSVMETQSQEEEKKVRVVLVEEEPVVKRKERLVLDEKTTEVVGEKPRLCLDEEVFVADSEPKENGDADLSTLAITSSPIISSPAVEESKKTLTTPAEPPAGCSTPLSGERKSRGAIRLGVSGLAERLHPKRLRRGSAPSKLSLSHGDGQTERVKRPLARLMSAGASRGAKMVALAQANQAERREKARVERETNGSTASDSSFSSQRSLTSPPGIIRSFFTPSKGHRVSFREPLTSTWDGASPRVASNSMCVEVGTPKGDECRKSLIEDFEAANSSWEEGEKKETTVAMVEGEAVSVTEFHADVHETMEMDKEEDVESEKKVEEALPVPDKEKEESAVPDDSEEIPDSEPQKPESPIVETDVVVLSDSDDSKDDNPPAKRRRIDVSEPQEDTQAIPVPEEDTHAIPVPEEDTHAIPVPEEDTQPIPVTLVDFSASEASQEASQGAATVARMFLDAGETQSQAEEGVESEATPRSLEDVVAHVSAVKEGLEHLTAEDKVVLARDLAQLLQTCLMPASM